MRPERSVHAPQPCLFRHASVKKNRVRSKVEEIITSILPRNSVARAHYASLAQPLGIGRAHSHAQATSEWPGAGLLRGCSGLDEIRTQVKKLYSESRCTYIGIMLIPRLSYGCRTPPICSLQDDGKASPSTHVEQ